MNDDSDSDLNRDQSISTRGGEPHTPQILDLQKAGAEIRTAGGNCPVQIEGKIDNHFFYFRARGQRWSCEFAANEADLCTESVSFRVVRPYGNEPFAAGWMPLSEACGYTLYAITEFRQTTAPCRASIPSG